MLKFKIPCEGILRILDISSRIITSLTLGHQATILYSSRITQQAAHCLKTLTRQQGRDKIHIVIMLLLSTLLQLPHTF